MPAYVIADVEITDPVKFEEYRSQLAPTIEQYGGRYLVRGGATEKVEGEWLPKRLVIIEFDSMQRAREWYYSHEYSGPMKLRHQSANSNVLLVEGVQEAR
jgi:uncharacterized protein (DUF1330 family)